MNKLFAAAATAALLAAVQPASAMCGGGQQAQTPGNTMSTGMMCGMPAAADDPMSDKPKAQQSGMCSCCRNMAMMPGGNSGSGMQHMPGMEMPKK